MPDKVHFKAFAIGSALLNAFLLGVLLTHFIMPGPMPFHPPEKGMPFMHMSDAAMKLDQPYRDKVLAILSQNQAKMQGNMEKMMATMPEIDGALTAAKFDPSALKTVNVKLEGYDKAIKEDMLDTMMSIASVLPNKERIEFFKEISPQHHGMHGPPPPF